MGSGKPTVPKDAPTAPPVLPPPQPAEECPPAPKKTPSGPKVPRPPSSPYHSEEEHPGEESSDAEGDTESEVSLEVPIPGEPLPPEAANLKPSSPSEDFSSYTQMVGRGKEARDIRQLCLDTHAEALTVSKYQRLAAHHVAEATSKNFASLITLRRHAWLRSANIVEDIKTRVENLPFDATGLFSQNTDENLENLHKSKKTAKSYSVQTAPRQSKPQWRPKYTTQSYQQPSTSTYRPYGGNSSQRPPQASSSSSAAFRSQPSHSNRQGDTSPRPTPNNSGLGVDLPPRPGLPPIDSVEDIPSIMEVLDKARKPSTMRLYQHKWQGFLKFTTERGLQASPVSLSTLLLYLRHLFDLGLTKSTLKVYTSAIVTFQPKGSQSSRWFSHPTVKAFFRGLSNMRPPVRRPLPQWSLQTVLHSLVRPPFEPMATCDLKFLSLKTLFLVAITSARRASELAALRADSPYLQFFKDKVVLYPDVSFLPKVVSDFHVNQPLLLPTLFSEPSSDIERTLHCLDVRRALSFYISRTKDFRKVQRLFLCYYGQRKGTAASTSTLFRWLVSTTSLAYELQHKPLPENLRAHSTRAVATSTALLRGVDIPDICRAATWSSVSTFIKHYRLDLRAKNETRFGRAILTSLLQ
ncbi:uncharacterized protein LOC144587068 [Pogona vitticeps]